MKNTEKPGITNADSLKEFINLNRSSDIIALPTAEGISFYEKNHILLFQSVSLKPSKRSHWEAMLIDNSLVKLPNKVTAEIIFNHLPKDSFFQIHQSYIINRAYLGDVVFKTNVCKLIEPHDKLKLNVSRDQLTKMRSIFEIK